MKLDLDFEKTVKVEGVWCREIHRLGYLCLLKFLYFRALIMNWNRAPSPHFLPRLGGCFETVCVFVWYFAIKHCKNKQLTCWNAGLSPCLVLWDFFSVLAFFFFFFNLCFCIPAILKGEQKKSEKSQWCPVLSKIKSVSQAKWKDSDHHMQESPDASSERLFKGLACFMTLVFFWQLVIYFSFLSDF